MWCWLIWSHHFLLSCMWGRNVSPCNHSRFAHSIIKPRDPDPRNVACMSFQTYLLFKQNSIPNLVSCIPLQHFIKSASWNLLNSYQILLCAHNFTLLLYSSWAIVLIMIFRGNDSCSSCLLYAYLFCLSWMAYPLVVVEYEWTICHQWSLGIHSWPCQTAFFDLKLHNLHLLFRKGFTTDTASIT